MKKKLTPATSLNKSTTAAPRKSRPVSTGKVPTKRAKKPAAAVPGQVIAYELVPSEVVNASLGRLADRIAGLCQAVAGDDWVVAEVIIDRDGIGSNDTMLRINGPKVKKLREDVRG